MDYLDILKQAYKITIKHRFLWIFGLFAGGASFAGNFISMPANIGREDNWSSFINQSNPISWQNFWLNYWGLMIALIGISLLIIIALVAFSIISSGALLGGVAAADKGEEVDFKTAYSFGWRNFWRVLAVNLVFFLLVLFTLIILIVPLVLFVVAKIYVLAVVYGLLIFLADLVLWLYLGLIVPYIQRLVILDGRGIFEAFSESWEFFKKNWQPILITYLLMWAVSMGVGIAFILAALFLGGTLFILGFALYLVSQSLLWMNIVIFGGIFVITMAIFAGAYNAFGSAVFTLVFRRLEKNP